MHKPNELTFRERKVKGATRIDVLYPNEVPKRSLFNRLVLAMKDLGAAAAWAMQR